MDNIINIYNNTIYYYTMKVYLLVVTVARIIAPGGRGNVPLATCSALACTLLLFALITHSWPGVSLIRNKETRIV